MSGTKHDNGKSDLSILPPAGLRGAARVFTFGATKYGRYNFMGGFKVSRLVAASMRHITAWMWGENLDPESGESHLHHALCCLLMLCQILEANTATDDRWKPQIETPDLQDLEALSKLESETRHLTRHTDYTIIKSENTNPANAGKGE